MNARVSCFSVVLGAVMTLTSAHLAFGHIIVVPAQSTQGARERYTVRVPNEMKVDCIRIEGEFPADAGVFRLEYKPEWNVNVKRDAEGNILSAVWTGRIPPDLFVEFGMLGINSKTASRVVWKFVQHFTDGSTEEFTGPPGSPTPSPITMLMPAKPMARSAGN